MARNSLSYAEAARRVDAINRYVAAGHASLQSAVNAAAARKFSAVKGGKD